MHSVCDVRDAARSTTHTAHSRQWSPPLPHSPLQQRSASTHRHVAHAQQSTLRASNAEFTLHRQQFVRAQAAPHRNCARRRQHRHRLKSHTDTDTDTRSVYMFASLSLCVVCTVRTANGAMKSACCAQYGWALLRGLCVCVWAIGCVERI